MSVRFGETAALDGVDLCVAPGEVVGIIGASGAGKSTLLRVLNAGVVADSGGAVIQGRPADKLRGRALRATRAQIGFIDQSFGLVPRLRVIQNVLLGRVGRQGMLSTLRRMLWQSRVETHAVYAILQQLGIETKLYQRAEDLSHGQQQRVAIARALYQDPTCLLADEPISSVDPQRSRQVLSLLIDLAQRRGLTLVVALHDLELAKAMFPRLIGMRQGRVVFDCASDDITEGMTDALYAH